MVARMMRWRPWPPARKFEVRLVVRRVEGVRPPARLGVEVKWKGPRAALRPLRPAARRNRTREEEAGDDGAVRWEEDFRSVCSLAAHRDSAWEIAFAVFAGSNEIPKKKEADFGTASLNLTDYVSAAQEKEIEISLPLSPPGVSTETQPSLHLALSLLELRTSQESSEAVRSVVPVPLSPSSGDAPASEKDELSALKAGLRKVKLFTEFVSTRKAKKAYQEDEGSEERCSDKSDNVEYMYPFDTDSLDDDLDEGETEVGKEDNFRKSFNYGTLASANYFGSSFYSDLVVDGEVEDCIYYSHRRSDVGCSHVEDTKSSEQVPSHATKKSILPWKKRKLSFRSPKAKGEPLLKKAYGEEGGDDIDFDRRQLSSSDESLQCLKGADELAANQPSVSEFGDDNFAVGCWVSKELVSRDGHMKLHTQVFFASIDQRSERAAGESACTALVAVIADWFQANRDMMPIKSQFDSLIREGSLEWRELCENQMYRERFPDRHFDLETILQAKIRPLSVVPEKSFIGFFHPEDTGEDTSGFDFLHGAMSFDNIWDEISRAGSDCPADGSPLLYVVSWNDHFFVLKVERDTYYIIDTLGERLHEGCDQAYILKFDESTSIHRVPDRDKATTSESAVTGGQQVPRSSDKATSSESTVTGGQQVPQSDSVKEGLTAGQLEGGTRAAEEEQRVCKGKESCKEYIKSFLAAIPIRELQADIKKGLTASTMLHHRLQVEFHYTTSTKEMVAVERTDFRRPEEPTAFEIVPTSSAPAMQLEAGGCIKS